ncbi:hypothetical protein COB64_02035 [Candidatus Wolfebacteria bacterium]|nr:MAG: hypothetical protein COB64_02035 [Candidatus Wolfebacteria bacterium]
MALAARATQNFVPIKEIRNGIVVLKDGGLRAVLMASSINLSLKSLDEQNATIRQFQSFLNSLDFSTQIVVQSRKLDIRPYIILLENRMKEQVEPLLKIQTREYIQFIRNFTESRNIMTKSFIIVVPYTAPALGPASGLKGLTSIFSSKKKTKVQEGIDFAEKQSQLEQRVGVIQGGLARMGVRSVQLGTEEVVELFYKTFNPGDPTGTVKFEE